MKKQYILSVLLIINILFFSCKKTTSQHFGVPVVIGTGVWKINYYHLSSVDHTTLFSGYQFTFNSNGSMIVVNGSDTTAGTWTSDETNNEFQMQLGNAIPFDEIDNRWLITANTTSDFELKDENTSHNEVLYFTKN